MDSMPYTETMKRPRHCPICPDFCETCGEAIVNERAERDVNNDLHHHDCLYPED